MKNKTINEGGGLVSPYLLVNISTLRVNVGKSNIAQDTMSGLGLTEDAIDDLIECRYNKVRDTNDRSVWSYDGYETSTSIELYIRQGDGDWAMTAFACRKDKNTGLWTISMMEV